jgi:hypothetical protein
MTVEYKLKEERTYPYAGVLKDDKRDIIVFFVAPEVGVRLSSIAEQDTDPVNRICYKWNEKLFKVCEEITIKM